MNHKIILGLLLLPFILLSENRESDLGIEIKRSKFIEIATLLNAKLETRDTNNLNFNDCIEVIRINNSLRFYGLNYWARSTNDSIIINSFISLYEYSNPFNRQLENYIFRVGKGEVSNGLGIYYSEFNIYSGGRSINNNSLYRKKQKFLNKVFNK